MFVKCIPTRIDYCVELTQAQWDYLDNRDNDNQPIHNSEHPKILHLKQLGAEEIDWNGHFGRNFFFACAIEDSEAVIKGVQEFFKGEDYGNV